MTFERKPLCGLALCNGVRKRDFLLYSTPFLISQFTISKCGVQSYSTSLPYCGATDRSCIPGIFGNCFVFFSFVGIDPSFTTYFTTTDDYHAGCYYPRRAPGYPYRTLLRHWRGHRHTACIQVGILGTSELTMELLCWQHYTWYAFSAACNVLGGYS